MGSTSFSRRSEKAVGRIQNISTREDERYLVCTILLRTVFAASIADQRAVDGGRYDTYLEICVRLGLFQDDVEWN